MNCFQAKAGQIVPQWYVIDASNQVVGRLAAQIAPILMGKHRPTYTPHIDTGDYVIVTNVDKVVFTGNKWQQKSYQRYSGHPGGQKDEVAWKLFQRHPDRILELAIKRMMPKNKIGRHMMGKLKLVIGSDHEHQAQQPIPLPPLSGRVASAGALWTPEAPPQSDKPKVKKKVRAKAKAAPAPAAPQAEAALPAPHAEAALPAPEPEAALPAPQPEAALPAPEPEAALPKPEGEGEGEGSA